MHNITPFCGSYLPGDIQFLLRPVQLEMTPVDVKEKLIQSGARHYSDMLSQEPAPTGHHLDLFARALDAGAARMAREVVMLANALIRHCGDRPVVLVSLVRAGVPLGVMLHHAIQAQGKTSHHYGISIIRDRGIDTAALALIEKRHGTDGIVFVDGWTGKGAISGELSAALRGRPGYPELPRLVVLADPCGCAWLSASDDDWLIPFGIMGATVSGLVSRSIWAEHGLHGFVHCEHLRQFDCSRALVETVARRRQRLDAAAIPAAQWHYAANAPLRDKSRAVVASLAQRFAVDSVNRIKPGIAEATRAVLRRVPDHVLVRQADDPDVALLVYLAEKKRIAIRSVGDAIGQYRAVTIIKKVL